MRIDFSNNKKAYGYLALRWLMLPFLLYAFGGFLEGPPTRVVVRSFAFVVGCFLLSILAAQFLQQVRRIPIALSLLQALVIPGGYVYFAQLYYNGGKNQDYSIAIGIFFLLMMLNAAVYLNGLFALRQKVTSAAEDIEPDPIEEYEDQTFEPDAGYEITLYKLDSEGQRGFVELQEQGGEDLPGSIVVDGFSKDTVIDLNEYWDVMLNGDLGEYITNVTTYETIIKFGEPMQLINNYQIVLKLS
jgi:hypothetical protein